MSKRFWTRLFLWLRFGSGWHWWQLLPGDFWWSYRETDDSLSVALLHSLDQLERYGFLWFYRSDSLPSANELFDRSHFAAYELRGFYPQLQSA